MRVSQVNVIAVPAADTIIAGNNGSRVRLDIYPVSTNVPAWVLNAPMTAIAQGILILSPIAMLTLEREAQGEIVCHEWHAFGAPGVQLVVIETMETECGCKGGD